MARLYVGNLPMNMNEKDLEDVFYKYGRITDVHLKTPDRPPAFGFVTFEDMRDAEEAIRARDGYDMDGYKLRVEMSRGRREGPRFGGGGGYGGGPPPFRGGGGGKQTEFQVVVTGLPPSASWQDLKDHMRKAGDVTYTDVDQRGGGIVHFSAKEDMQYALRKLNDSEFRNRYDNAFIQVLPHRDLQMSPPRGGGGRGRSRSPRRSPRRRSPSRSRSRSRGR